MPTTRARTALYPAATISFILSASAFAAPPAKTGSAQQQNQLQQQQQQLYQQQIQQQQQQQQLQQQQMLDQQQQQQRQQQQQQQQQNAADTTQLNSLTADAAKARAELKKAQAALQTASHKFESEIDSKPEVQAALKEFKSAQDAYQTANATATQSLKNNPDYQKSLVDAREARAKVDALRSDATATPTERYAAATASLAANKAVTAFESGATTKDPRVAESRKRLTAANDALRKAREAFSGIMHDDPTWQAANSDVEQKQKDVAAADSKLADAKKSVADRIRNSVATRSPNSTISPATQPVR